MSGSRSSKNGAPSNGSSRNGASGSISSRRYRRRANAERNRQVILRAAIIGAYCVVLLIAGLYLGYKGRERPEPAPASLLELPQNQDLEGATDGDTSGSKPAALHPSATTTAQGDPDQTGAPGQGGSGNTPAPAYGGADNPAAPALEEPGTTTVLPPATDRVGSGSKTSGAHGTKPQTTAQSPKESGNGPAAIQAGEDGDHTGDTGDHTGDTGDHIGDTGDHTGDMGDYAGDTSVPATAFPKEIPAWPVSGEVVGEPRWVFSEFLNEWRYLPGVEIAVIPDTPVTASMSGKVVSVRTDPDLGTVVTLEHAGGMTTEYGRLSGCILGVGDTVKQGEEIARTGGTTLYFGTSVNEEAVSATEYLTP